MRIRRLLLATLALGLAATPVAHATQAKAVKKLCNLVADGDGDGGLQATKYGPVNVNSPTMDILGADFATGAKTVVSTIRVASLDLDPQALPEVTYAFFFKVKGVGYSFSLVRDHNGREDFSFSNGSVTGKVDAGTKTIRFTSARSGVKELAKPGQTVTEIRATTKTRVSNADSANDTTKKYKDKTPSCLSPA